MRPAGAHSADALPTMQPFETLDATLRDGARRDGARRTGAAGPHLTDRQVTPPWYGAESITDESDPSVETRHGAGRRADDRPPTSRPPAAPVGPSGVAPRTSRPPGPEEFIRRPPTTEAGASHGPRPAARPGEVTFRLAAAGPVTSRPLGSREHTFRPLDADEVAFQLPHPGGPAPAPPGPWSGESTSLLAQYPGPAGPRPPAARPAPGRSPHVREERERPANGRSRLATDAPSTRSAPVRGTAPDRIGADRAAGTPTVVTSPVSDRVAADRIDETLTRLTEAHVADGTAAEPPRPSRSRPKPLLVVAAVAALLVFTASAAGTVTRGSLDRAVRGVDALDRGSSAIVDAAAQRGDRNVLVVGSDDPGATDRADTVAIAHVPAGGGPPVVLPFPTALEINRPPCARYDAASATYSDEIVPAQARAQLIGAVDVGGPRCAVRVIQQLSGLAVTGYVGVDVRALETLADAAGGVEVCVADPVVDDVLGQVVPQPGATLLTGLPVSDFARAGAVPGDPPSGIGRISRQQKLLAGVLGSVLTDTGLLDVPRVFAMGPALARTLITDGLELEQVLAVARSVPASQAAGLPVAAEPTSRGNVLLRDADASSLFAAVREDITLPAQDGSSTAGPTPADVTVDVLNASDRSDLATQVGDTLRSLGFGVGAAGNTEQPTPATIIRFSPDRSAAAALLADSVPSATSVPDPGSSGVLQLVLGRSFDDVVEAPTTPVVVPSTPSSTAACP